MGPDVRIDHVHADRREQSHRGARAGADQPGRHRDRRHATSRWTRSRRPSTVRPPPGLTSSVARLDVVARASGHRRAPAGTRRTVPDLPGMPGRRQLRRRPVPHRYRRGTGFAQSVGVLRRPAQADNHVQQPPAGGDRGQAPRAAPRAERRRLPGAGGWLWQRRRDAAAHRRPAHAPACPAGCRLPGRPATAPAVPRPAAREAVRTRLGGAGGSRQGAAGGPGYGPRSSLHPGLGRTLPRTAEQRRRPARAESRASNPGWLRPRPSWPRLPPCAIRAGTRPRSLVPVSAAPCTFRRSAGWSMAAPEPGGEPPQAVFSHRRQSGQHPDRPATAGSSTHADLLGGEPSSAVSFGAGGPPPGSRCAR